jgi:alkylation response protein AidB-like acyl-CoA dehydrogenase
MHEILLQGISMASGITSDVTALPLTHLSEDEQLFRSTVRDFARETIGPLIRQMDDEQHFAAELLPQLFSLGLMGIEIPTEYGGSGGTFFEAILAVEEISAIDPSVGVLVDVQNTLCVNAFQRWGTEDQKRRYLPQMAADTVAAYALSEAASGSDAFALQARAERRSDGYVLNGQKLWITNAKEAEIFIVFATLDPTAGYKGITAFIVERKISGFNVGKKEDKLGIRASSTCELILEDCRIPSENVMGEPGKGYKIAIETLNEGRIGIGAQMLGLAQGAWNCAAKYALERKQFGKAIAEFQAVQFALAEMAAEIEATRLLVYNAARLKDAHLDFVREAAIAKYFSSQVAERVASQAVEIYGGYGFVKDYPVEKYYRDAKIGKIYEGTSNMQLATIAKLVLAGMK